MNNPIFAKYTYWGACFLVFGIFISVSIPSVFHILAFIPAVIINRKYIKQGLFTLPKSAWVLIVMVCWAYFVNIVNFDILNDSMRSFGKVKYWIFAILSINLFQYSLDTYVSNHRIKKLLNIFWFSIICAAVYGLFKSFPDRVSSFTGTMRYGYGMGLALTLMTGIWFNLSKLDKTVSKKFFYLAITLGVLGFLATKTRGALVGFTASAPFIFYFYKKKLGLIVGIVVSVILATVVLISLNGGSDSFRVLNKFGNSSNLKRIAQYEAALRSINDRPLTGVGINNFSSRCMEIKKEYGIHWPKYCEKYPSLACTDKPADYPVYCGHAHNIFLEHGANMGILGAVLLLLWLLIWIYELWKLNTVAAKIIIPFAINIFISGQFENIFDANNSFFIFFVYSLSFLIKNKEKLPSC